MTTRLEHRPRRGGFTLLELLVVLMIMGVVGTFAYPRVTAVTDETALNQAAAAIRTDLQRAFSEAAKNRRPVRVVITPGDRRYTVTDRATNQVIFTRELGAEGSGYRIKSLTATVTTFDVFPSGLASSPVTLTIGINDKSRQVTMTRVGLTQVQ